MPGLQLAHHERIAEEIQVPTHGRLRNGHGASQFSAVKDLAMIVGQHGPKAPERLSRDLEAQPRQIALQKLADEIPAPGHTVGVRLRQKRPWKSPTHPQCLAGLKGYLLKPKTIQIVVGYPPCK